jgi:hypothetical protein
MKKWNPLPLLLAVSIVSLLMAAAPRPADATPPLELAPRVTLRAMVSDAYIRPNQSTNGTGTSLVAGDAGTFTGYKILLRFNMATAPQAGTYQKARLVLVTAPGGVSGYDYSSLYVSGTNWNNNSSYATADDQITGTSAGSATGIEQSNKAVYELTNYGGSYAITLNNTEATDELTVYSSDNSSEGNRPKLEYYYSAKPGDANLDGHFNSTDQVLVFQAGKYETGQPATWAEGDWNEDGVFNSSDFVYANQNNTYEG